MIRRREADPERGTIADVRKINERLRHYQRVEASYRAEIRRAHEALKEDRANPTRAEARYRKVKDKYERKIDKLLPKIKRLTALRNELKGRPATKG